MLIFLIVNSFPLKKVFIIKWVWYWVKQVNGFFLTTELLSTFKMGIRWILHLQKEIECTIFPKATFPQMPRISFSKSNLCFTDRIGFNNFATQVWVWSPDQQDQASPGLVKNAQAPLKPAESESTFEQDAQVVHVHSKVWEALVYNIHLGKCGWLIMAGVHIWANKP